MNIDPMHRRLIFALSLLSVLAFLALAGPLPVAMAEPSAPDGVTETVTLTPVADLTVSQFVPDAAADPSLATLTISKDEFLRERRPLLRFDLSAIPAHATIVRATLELTQIDASPATWDWDLMVARLVTDWDPDKTAWNNRPRSVCCQATVTSPGANGVTIAFDVRDLVQQWVSGGLANFGLELNSGPAGLDYVRKFDSAEGDKPPRLTVEYIPIPDSIVVPAGASNIDLDGVCDTAGEYADAKRFSYVDNAGLIADIYLKHDLESLYLCVDTPLGKFPERFFSLYLDTDHGQEKYAEGDDLWLRAYVEVGATDANRGTGDQAQVWKPDQVDGWKAVAAPQPDLRREAGEYVVSLDHFSAACPGPFGIAVMHQDVFDNGDNYGWPSSQVAITPAGWISAVLEAPRCVRVCSETAQPCDPVAGAAVHDLASGDRYATDGNGYVVERTRIPNGTKLWATRPMEVASDHTLYQTSGPPVEVSDAAFQGEPGTLTLVLRQDQPLWVQDLDISAQWLVTDSVAYAGELADNIRRASDYFYDFSEGQFALGDVTVQQVYDGWDQADVRLYLSNINRPNSVVGGIVSTPTVDISPAITLTYQPGAISMGKAWNRYQAPPGQPIVVDGAPVPPETLADDWAIALAHELGHYLFFLFDTYVDAAGNESVELGVQCANSAMGYVYDPVNQSYVFDQQHWDANCGETEAHAKLQGRTEWDTIATWYPWAVKPVGSQPMGPGPRLVPPVELTTVAFVTASNPPTQPLVLNQTFTIDYVDGETASPEARAFLFRGKRIFDQGKPPAGQNQVSLTDARAADRLCVYDLNDHGGDGATARHQFGCESIQPGDATLAMTRDMAWQPVVELRQVSATQIGITVTQPLSNPGTSIWAQVYPEHGEAFDPVTLVRSGDLHAITFDFGGPVTAVYIQLWIDESPLAPDTRREVLTDRGVGGGGVFGPASQLGGVIVLSADGKASFQPDGPLDLGPGHSMAWQSMPGTPPLPPGARIIGQSYRLDAFPPELVDSGTVSIEYQGTVPSVAAADADQAAAGDPPAIHFWDGETWTALPTVNNPLHGAADGVMRASASSQGVGVYAVLAEQAERLYLPLVWR